MGTPYRLGGNDRRGIDCSGFAVTLYRDVTGAALPRTTSAQWKTGRSIASDRLTAGDLVFFDTEGHGVSHVGVYLDGNQFAHASTSKGVMISSLREAYWRQHFLGGRRVL